VVVKSNGQLGVAATPAASTASLAATVKRLAAENARQQRQLEELRGQLERLTD
jgi:antitoxin component of MazEF toxin-antitoxin module